MNALPLWNSEEAATACQGRATRPWLASGVSIDTRTLAPGDLFIAIRGPTFDGHDFVADALARGAAAAVVSRMPAAVSIDAPLLIVDNTLTALRALGEASRARAAARVIAVTGSVGKTSVKEALKSVLSRQARTYATVGSLNNHWGLPLSLARLDTETRYGVFELGMNHAGEIEPLSRLARPHVAAITTVEAVHIENFDSVEAVADAKAEIFAGVVNGGVAVINRDNVHYQRLAGAARRAGVGTIIGFGSHSEAEARLVAAALGPDGSDVRAEICGCQLAFRIATPGAHWVTNSLCVLATVAATGASVEAAADALADIGPIKGRGQRHRIAIKNGAFTLVDDSYNASPVSMAAALAVLGAQTPGAAGRRLVALGDMLELGSSAAAQHAQLAAPIEANDIDLVFACGPHMAGLFESLAQTRRGGYAADAAALAPLVAAAVRPGDVVTVKGSAGSRMRLVVEALQSLGPVVVAAASRPANGA